MMNTPRVLERIKSTSPMYIEASITIAIIAAVEAATSFLESQETFLSYPYDSIKKVFTVWINVCGISLFYKKFTFFINYFDSR